ncbi:hypothetical protein ACFW4M_32740 [Streptomyces sp. NPDC058794]|uniref:hypothetical protein n=1 Tax=Streptomyces TaxID=1883 RepID=UPI0036B7BD4A
MTEAPPPFFNAYDTPPDAPDGFYAAHITYRDAEALDAFLQARAEEVWARYRPDAPEARMAVALYEAGAGYAQELRDLCIENKPETLADRARLWTHLVHTVEPWRDTPGHDGDRWRLVWWDDELEHRKHRRAWKGSGR